MGFLHLSIPKKIGGLFGSDMSGYGEIRDSIRAMEQPNSTQLPLLAEASSKRDIKSSRNVPSREL